MDILLNVIQNLGVPIGVMWWFMTAGTKMMMENTAEIKKLSQSNADLQKAIIETFSDLKNISTEQTKEILEFMLKNTKK